MKLCRDTRSTEDNLFAMKIMDKMVLKKKRQGAPVQLCLLCLLCLLCFLCLHPVMPVPCADWAQGVAAQGVAPDPAASLLRAATPVAHLLPCTHLGQHASGRTPLAEMRAWQRGARGEASRDMNTCAGEKRQELIKRHEQM